MTYELLFGFVRGTMIPKEAEKGVDLLYSKNFCLIDAPMYDQIIERLFKYAGKEPAYDVVLAGDKVLGGSIVLRKHTESQEPSKVIYGSITFMPVKSVCCDAKSDLSQLPKSDL